MTLPLPLVGCKRHSPNDSGTFLMFLFAFDANDAAAAAAAVVHNVCECPLPGSGCTPHSSVVQVG